MAADETPRREPSGSWPAVATERELDALMQRAAELLPGVRALAKRLGLDQDPPEACPGGSLPVFLLGSSRVLKLYPGPAYVGARGVEAGVLNRRRTRPRQDSNRARAVAPEKHVSRRKIPRIFRR